MQHIKPATDAVTCSDALIEGNECGTTVVAGRSPQTQLVGEVSWRRILSVHYKLIKTPGQSWKQKLNQM